MPEKISISNGVDMLYISNKRFHTTLVSFNFYLPISKENVSVYALLTSILTTCSAKYRDFRELNLALNRLYGADISSTVSKVGDKLCLKFKVSTINDEYAFGGEKPISQAVDMLLRLLFEPKVNNVSFEDEDVKREKRMLIEHINGELNDKRLYARKRLTEEMFEGEPYGLYRLGNVADIEQIDGKQLYTAWQNMLSNAVVKINVIGKTLPMGIVENVKKYFCDAIGRKVGELTKTVATAYRDEPKYVTEKLDIAQGKLVIGFTSVFGDDENTADAMVMSDIFGGGPYSLLFNNVREKQSLCYYCSCQSVRNKGYLIVDSGIEAKNSEKALKEILNQLSVLQKGEFTDYEFDASKKGLNDSLMSANDSLGGIDSWYTLRALQKRIFSPEELAKKINNVSKQDVVNAANKVKLNTVYMLLPKEEAL